MELSKATIYDVVNEYSLMGLRELKTAVEEKISELEDSEEE